MCCCAMRRYLHIIVHCLARWCSFNPLCYIWCQELITRINENMAISYYFVQTLMKLLIQHFLRFSNICYTFRRRKFSKQLPINAQGCYLNLALILFYTRVGDFWPLSVFSWLIATKKIQLQIWNCKGNRKFPNFEVSQSHFPKPEHLLAKL